MQWKLKSSGAMKCRSWCTKLAWGRSRTCCVSWCSCSPQTRVAPLLWPPRHAWSWRSWRWTWRRCHTREGRGRTLRCPSVACCRRHPRSSHCNLRGSQLSRAWGCKGIQVMFASMQRFTRTRRGFFLPFSRPLDKIVGLWGKSHRNSRICCYWEDVYRSYTYVWQCTFPPKFYLLVLTI